jgi:hypothetical protein
LDLLQHPLFEASLRDNDVFLFLALPRLKHRRETKGVEDWAKERRPSVMPEPYNHYRLVLYRLHRIAIILQSMSYSESLLSKPPGEKLVNRHGMSQADWFNYHYAAFIVQALTVPEAALVLLNDVGYFGFPEKLCTRQILLGNWQIRPTPAGKAIERLYEVVNPLRDMRHSYVHRGETPDHGDESLDRYEFIEAGLRLVDGSEALFGHLREPLRRARREANKEFAQTMRKTRIALGKHVLALYDALLPVYEATKARLPSPDDRFVKLVEAMGLDEKEARRAVASGQELRRAQAKAAKNEAAAHGGSR